MNAGCPSLSPHFMSWTPLFCWIYCYLPYVPTKPLAEKQEVTLLTDSRIK